MCNKKARIKYQPGFINIKIFVAYFSFIHILRPIWWHTISIAVLHNLDPEMTGACSLAIDGGFNDPDVSYLPDIILMDHFSDERLSGQNCFSEN